MAKTVALLGVNNGTATVLSDIPNFAGAYALASDKKLIPFQAVTVGIDLVESLEGVNLLLNGDFSAPIEHWKILSDKKPRKLGCDFSADWHLIDGHTAYMQIPLNVDSVQICYNDPEFGESIPAIAGQIYTAQGYFAIHRGHGNLRLSALDTTGQVVLEKAATISSSYLGGRALDRYQLVCISLPVPQEATTLQLKIEFTGHIDSPIKNDAFMFFTQVSLALGKNSRGCKKGTSLLLHQVKFGKEQVAGFTYSAQVDVDAVSESETLQVVPLIGGVREPLLTLNLEDISGVTAKILPFEGNSIGIRVTGYDNALSVRVDGKELRSLLRSNTPGLERNIRVIVDDYLDGDVHFIELRDASGLRVLARDVQLFPFTLTPWDALQKHSNAPFPDHLAHASHRRYQALLDQLSLLEKEVVLDNPTTDTVRHLATLPYLHRILEGGFECLKRFQPLSFPQYENPKISVIIPVHNKFNVTYFALCALLFAPNKASFEVIIVDDGSSDETLKLTELVSNITVTRNEIAQGFVRACNLGATYAKGDYIVLLNNDTEPTTGWLDELLIAFEHFDKVGMVGSKLLYPDGRLQEAGGIVWNNGNPWNYGRGANPRDPRYSYARQADYLSGAALMLPRKIWDEVGGLSDEFAPAYFEDTDLGFKVRNAGYTTWFIPTSIVYHFEGLSNGTDVDTSTGLKRYQEINRPKFKRKWAAAVRSNGEEGVNPDLAKDRGIIGRALFVDYSIPKTDMDAGSYAALQEMRLMQSLGYKITFVATNLAYMGRYDIELNRLGIETISAPFYLSIESLLQNRGKEFDIVYITRYYCVAQVIDHVRQYAPKAKVLFCNADLHFLREMRKAQQSKVMSDWRKSEETRTEELAMMCKVDLILSYNEAEHAVILSHILMDAKVTKCPWVVETQSADRVPGFNERSGIAFLGSYNHWPNVDAVLFFVNEVMPKLRSRLPGVSFNIYGSNMSEKITQLKADDINPIGYVETVDEVYNTNRIFIAPLLTGAGIKGKVLGALSYGIPSIISSMAAESTGVRDSSECLIVDKPDAWVEAIVSIYNDQAAWEAMSQNARAFTDKFYSFEQGREVMRAALEQIGIFNSL